MTLQQATNNQSEDAIPFLNLTTTDFREQFPTDTDFYNFVDSRNEIMLRSDGFAGELANTLGKCPVCRLFTSMSDLLGIAYVEKHEAKSEDELEDNFFGCPDCFIKHLKKHGDKIGRIGF